MVQKMYHIPFKKYNLPEDYQLFSFNTKLSKIKLSCDKKMYNDNMNCSLHKLPNKFWKYIKKFRNCHSSGTEYFITINSYFQIYIKNGFVEQKF